MRKRREIGEKEMTKERKIRDKEKKERKIRNREKGEKGES